MNVFYLIYVGHIDFYLSKQSKIIETFNESMNLTMCYSYLLLVNLVTEKEQRDNIGTQLLLAAGLLIVLNFSLLVSMVVKKLRTIYKTRLLKKRQ